MIRLASLVTLVGMLLAMSGCAGSRQVSTYLSDNTTPQINTPLEIPAEVDSFPDASRRSAAAPVEYTLAAENELLGLYINQATSAVLVEDKRNGVIWRSSPEGLQENSAVTNLWKRQIEIPFLLSYVDQERNQIKLAKPERSSFTLQPVVQGIKINYSYSDLSLGFTAILTLQDDALQVLLPDQGIIENETNRVVKIEVLSFFGAVPDGEEGFIFYPDGSGALMRFTSPHPEAVQKISNTIYGTGELSTVTNTYSEQQVMPVFGLVRGKAGFVSIIDHGDFDSILSLARAGKGVPYNHVWVEFTYRRQGRFSLTGGQPTWLYQPDRTNVDSRVVFQFLTEKDANYVGMASRYRQFLMEERDAKRITEKEPLINLAFVLGTERTTWFLRDMIVLTTFDDVDRIMQDFRAAGIERADVTLYNWNRGGVGNKYPVRLPVEKDFGGGDGLKKLAANLKARGYRLFLNDEYFRVAPGSTHIFPYLDAMRGVDGLPVGNADSGYFLNPQVAYRRFAVTDIPKIAQYGADGLAIDNLAGLTLPDKNNQYPLSREQFAASWMQIAALSRDHMGAVALSGSNTYAVPYADRLDFVTMDSTHYDLFDETVPFYHIAIHGLVVYTSPPYNLKNDGRRTFLRGVELGATPSFALSRESSAKLFRTNMNQIWSSEVSFWRDEIIRQYQDMLLLASLQNQFIVDHQRLAAFVNQVTYEDGSRVIINYREEPYVDGSLSVPALDFIVVKGD